jgi:Holliday junction resolvase-like predicted endonuclease
MVGISEPKVVEGVHWENALIATRAAVAVAMTVAVAEGDSEYAAQQGRHVLKILGAAEVLPEHTQTPAESDIRSDVIIMKENGGRKYRTEDRGTLLIDITNSKTRHISHHIISYHT